MMMPGCARGSMILKKVLMGVQPSTAAASSKVRERVAKKLSKKKVQKGTFRQMYSTSRVRCLLSRSYFTAME